MKLDNELLEEQEDEEFLDPEIYEYLLKLDKKTNLCDAMSVIFALIGAYFSYDVFKNGIGLFNLWALVSSIILLLACYLDSKRFSKYIIEIIDEAEEEE